MTPPLHATWYVPWYKETFDATNAHPGGDFASGALTSVIGCLLLKPLLFGAVQPRTPRDRMCILAKGVSLLGMEQEEECRHASEALAR